MSTLPVTSSWSGGGGAHGVLVHGGAGTLEGDSDAAASGCRSAAEAAHRVLAGGGSALDAVVAAVTVLEDDPRYNAGLGAALAAVGVGLALPWLQAYAVSGRVPAKTRVADPCGAAVAPRAR